MADRLVVDLGADGLAGVVAWPTDGGPPKPVSRFPVAWPLDRDALEELRWYLEDYLLAPFGVWEERGPAVQARLAGWGEAVFQSVFGVGPARDAYQRVRDEGQEVVFLSAVPGLLGLPWELMRDGSGPVALGKGGVSRSLPTAGGAAAVEVPGGRLRVLMVISRPAGTSDVGYQMVARPLLERLEAIRGEVELTVLRPPTFKALRAAVSQAADAGRPFHVVHFDGHGGMAAGSGVGVLALELPGGGSGPVEAARVAAALVAGRVPVVVLNACQSGAVGKELEASVATALLRKGCAAVVAMAYSVHAVAAAEFMAAFYESLFAGDSVGQAVTAGRGRLFERDGRPSQKGDMPLADWLVPVCYQRQEVRFPQARASRPAGAPSLAEALDQIRASPSGEGAAAQDQLAAMGAFVGRDDLFYQLEAAALEQRVVVLSGPGGTGKTELAKGFARWWRDTGGIDDPRLAFWHSFEPGAASFSLNGVITGIGLQVHGADFARLDPARQLDAVRQLLAEHRALLVWDNFESAAEMPDPAGATSPLDESGRAALREFLDWVRDHTASTVIITSRTQEAWLGQARRIAMGGLNSAEAAQYAVNLLAPFPAARPRREQRSFGELLEWLDGHPLAMRLTLPRLDTTDPALLLAGLRGITALPGGDDDGPGRLSSLGACITYSFTHLTERARRLLPGLSLFHGIADEGLLTLFSAAEAVPARFAGISKQEWTSVLEDASRVGLLTGIGAGMYRIHPALPGYLAAAWRADSPDGYDRERDACERALRAACAYFSWQAARQIESGDAALAYTLIGLQRRTLGAMLGHALDHDAWDEALEIVRALDHYLDVRGLGKEAAAWADRILAATAGPGPGQGPTATAESLWLYTSGAQANRQKDAGRPEKAAQAYRQVLAWLHDQPVTDRTRGFIAITYHQLGMTAQDRGRLDEADDWYRRAIEIREELGLRALLATDYHQLGITAQHRGSLDEAEHWYRRSLAIKEELGDRPSMAASYGQLGRIALARERLEEAGAWYLRTLAICTELGDRPGLASTYHQLGAIAGTRGQLEEAGAWYLRTLAICTELGDRPGLASTYHELGGIAQDRGRLEEADDWYRRSLAIKEELGNRPGMASTYHELGMTAQDRGRLDEAEGLYHRSLAISMDFGNRPGMAITYHQLGMTAQDRGRLDEADDWYRKSLAISTELGNRPGLARTYHQLGRTAQDRGRLDEADDWYRKSLAINEDLGNRPRMASAYHQLGVIAYLRGRLDEAGDWYRKSLAINEDLGNRPVLALTYAALGLLAEAKDQALQALAWNVRCVTLFGEFPSPLTGTGPAALARLTRQLGVPALQHAWRQAVGQPLPPQVRDYITSHDDDESSQP